MSFIKRSNTVQSIKDKLILFCLNAWFQMIKCKLAGKQKANKIFVFLDGLQHDMQT